jgi:predicted transcriptional regulator
LTSYHTKRLTKQEQKRLTDNLAIAIEQFFTDAALDQVARATKFVQRDSKINGQNFFDIIVFNNEQLKQQSLNDLAIDLSERYGITITKQSLHDRFNERALAFLQQALERLLNQQLDVAPLLATVTAFGRILIKDSICFQIDESLAASYPGSGGSGSAAAVRIQFEYDLLNGHITDLSVHGFNDQDATDSLETLELTQQGDLIIRDLAYMNLGVIKRLIDKGAFMLCRLQYHVTVYELTDNGYEVLDFVKLRTFMQQHQLAVMEKAVYVGAVERLKLRLIIHLLPDAVVAQRLRKAQYNNKKKGRKQLTKAYKARAALNLFITNATEAQIALTVVASFYRLRWQIELMFKIWKSLCHIDKVKQVKKERLECYIYAKLIGIVLSWQIIWAVAKFTRVKDNKALSYFKAFKTMLRVKLTELRAILFCGVGSMSQFMIDFYYLSKLKHRLERKQQKPTSIQLLITCLN